MIPCSLGKTLELGDIVFTTHRSDTHAFKTFATIVGFDNETSTALVRTKNAPKHSQTKRDTSQLICLTQQMSYNLENYPENIL
jgi:hypothetical protein